VNFVDIFTSRAGTPPTHDEIAAHFRWKSSFSVRQHLRLIEQKGALQRTPGKARCLKTTGQQPRDSVPLLGSIPAGPLAEAIQLAEDILPGVGGIFRGHELYALRVRGDSMKYAGILEGDLAVFDYQPEVRHGEIAAVLLKNESTLKRVLRTPSGITLHAENPAYKDIFLTGATAAAARIAGRLVGIIRQNP
jgi:repressor LexA